MKDEFTKDGYCNCRNPEEWKANDKIPISYDKELNEYNLVCGEGGRYHLIMYYCYFCGGKLPDSLRNEHFTEIDAGEEAEVKSLMSKIETTEEMYEILGEPDVVVHRDSEGDEFFVLKAEKECMHWYSYNRRWKSLDLQVREHEDGTLGFSFAAKYIGKKN